MVPMTLIQFFLPFVRLSNSRYIDLTKAKACAIGSKLALADGGSLPLGTVKWGFTVSIELQLTRDPTVYLKYSRPIKCMDYSSKQKTDKN